MIFMNREEFEGLVSEAIRNLPKEFLEKLDNVDIVVESWPNSQILGDLRIKRGTLLFGLYQGTPKTKRTKGTILPDKITLFAGPILTVSHTHEQIKKKVASVIKHEIAHHFGLDETLIRKTGH